MQVILDPTENDIAQAVETVIQKRPMLEPIVRSFAEILLEKTRIAGLLEVEPAASHLSISADRLSQGVPLLAETSLDVLRDQLNRSLRAMLAVLRKAFSHLDAGFSSIESLHHRGQLDLCKLSRASLDGQTSVLSAAAETAKAPEGILELALHYALSTVLKSLEPALRSCAEEVQWSRGYCPICGSMPSISVLAEAGDLGSEFLKKGGGQRVLHCSLCSHDWRFMRNRCPACDVEDNDLRLYFQLEEERSERVDVCRNCNGYLPCIDLRETSHRLPTDIAVVSMLHFDVWAAEKGYHPLARTPWNLVL